MWHSDIRQMTHGRKKLFRLGRLSQSGSLASSISGFAVDLLISVFISAHLSQAIDRHEVAVNAGDAIGVTDLDEQE